MESNCPNNINHYLDENEIDDVIMNQSVIAERLVLYSAAVDIEPQVEQSNQKEVSELTSSIVPDSFVSKEEDKLTTPKDLQKNHKILVNPTEIPKERQQHLSLKYFENRLEAKDVSVGENVKLLKD